MVEIEEYLQGKEKKEKKISQKSSQEYFSGNLPNLVLNTTPLDKPVKKEIEPGLMAKLQQ